MKRTIAFAVTLLAAQAAHAQFAVDMTLEEVRKAQGTMGVGDLAIEEIGLVTALIVCAQDGVLYVDRDSPLETERSEYGAVYRVQRKQGDKVMIEVKPGAKTKDPLASYFATSLRRALRGQCDRVGITADQRFEVISINGATSASKFLEEAK